MTIAWATLLPSDLGPTLRLAGARWRAFEAWWLARAATALPERWAAAWRGSEHRTLALWQTDEGCGAALLTGRGTATPAGAPDDRSASGLAAWQARQGGREATLIGLALDRSLFFQRDFKLPEAALPRLRELLDQEILRRTPFDLDEIWHGAEVRPCAPGLRRIHHWILRRDHALRHMAALDLAAASIDVLLVRESDGSLRPVIPFHPERDRGATATRPRLVGRLAALALVSTLASLGPCEVFEAARATRVSEALAAAGNPTGGRGGAGRDLQALLAAKSAPSLGPVWAELSRILPDDTFLTDLRLENGSVTIRGLSLNAAALVRAVSASPLFSTAALTAGIVPNAKEGRDGFSLTFDIRGAKVRKPHGAAPLPAGPVP